eukprot:Ihof_evm2s278 gene=Ihof_evmTU2s278
MMETRTGTVQEAEVVQLTNGNSPYPTVQYIKGSHLVVEGFNIGGSESLSENSNENCMDPNDRPLFAMPVVYSGLIFKAHSAFKTLQEYVKNDPGARGVQECVNTYRQSLEDAIEDCVTMMSQNDTMAEGLKVACEMREIMILSGLVFSQPDRSVFVHVLLKDWAQLSEPYWKYCRSEYYEKWRDMTGYQGSAQKADEELLWRSITREVLLCNLEGASQLVESHLLSYPNSKWALEQINQLLATMPVLTNQLTMVERRLMNQWQRQCREVQLQHAQSNDATLPTQALIFSLLAGDVEALHSLAVTFGMEWRDFALAFYTFIHPMTTLQGLDVDFESPVFVRYTKNDDMLRQIHLAIIRQDATRALDLIDKHYRMPWLTSHLSDIYFHCGQLDTGITMVGGMDLHEHCLLTYARELMDKSADYWQLALGYLAECKQTGLRHATAFVQSLQLDNNADFVRLLKYCRTMGLDEAANHVILSHAQLCIEREQYGDALIWLDEGNAAGKLNELSHFILKECLGLGTLKGRDLERMRFNVSLASSQLGMKKSINLNLCLSAAGLYVGFITAIQEGRYQDAYNNLVIMVQSECIPLGYQHRVFFGDSKNECDLIGLFEKAARDGKKMRMDGNMIQTII